MEPVIFTEDDARHIADFFNGKVERLAFPGFCRFYKDEKGNFVMEAFRTSKESLFLLKINSPKGEINEKL